MILLLLIALLLFPALSAGEDVGDLACILCHPSRDREAFEILSQTPGVITGSESAQRFVCLSCHNGSVVDSRNVLARGGQHPSGFQVRRTLPDRYPLYADRRMECGTCHSPHGEGPGAKGWLRDADDGTSPCLGCHAGRRDRHLAMTLDSDRQQRIAAVGGRFAAGGEVVCASCHVAHGAAGPKLLAASYGTKGDALCETCHPSLGVKGARPGDRAQPCNDCHVPHAEGPLMLAGGADGPCRACHQDRFGAGEHVAASPACSECHSVHRPVRLGGRTDGLLRTLPTGGLLCTSCHPNLGERHSSHVKVEESGLDLLLARGIEPGASGELECSTCHRVHDAESAPLLGLTARLLCLYCHTGENPYGPGGIKTGVHPVGVLLRGEQKKALAAATDDPESSVVDVLTCSTCHRAHLSAADAEARCADCHPGFTQGAGHGGVESCGACHQIHGQRPPALTCTPCHEEAQGGLHASGVSIASETLPAFDSSGRSVSWGSFGCPTCHDSHTATSNLLRGEIPSETCLSCHEDKATIFGGPHDGRFLEDRGEEGGMCQPCHPAHGSRVHGGDDSAGDACRSCHGSVLQSLADHSPSGPPAWAVVEGKLPLFDQSGKRNPYGFVTCPTCHDVHQGSERRAMRLEDRDPPQLCLTCHPQRASLLGTSHDPRREGKGTSCDLCHPAHSEGDVPPLWELRVEAHGSWNDRKCSPCHGPPEHGPAPHAGPSSHPSNLPLPADMKSPNLPLYDSLGGVPGRLVTCSTCHDLHGTPTPSGDVLPNFLRVDNSAGQLCGGCHTKEVTVIDTPHDLRERGLSELGPCGPCHTAHLAASERFLWGMTPAEGDYLPNTLCRSCHLQGGMAQGEYLLLQHHMKDAEELRTPRGTIYLQRPRLMLDEWSLRTGSPPVIPLYQQDGTAGPDGNLQCVSCHVPHQWSPMGPFVKPGFGAIGPNVPTRFLRLGDARAADRSVCSMCHQEDAVERYRRYHEVWEELGEEFR